MEGAFQLLATKNPSALADFSKGCKRAEEIEKVRLRWVDVPKTSQRRSHFSWGDAQFMRAIEREGADEEVSAISPEYFHSSFVALSPEPILHDTVRFEDFP